MNSLSEKKCVACSGDMPPLPDDEKKRLQGELDGWKLIENNRLERVFKTKNFSAGLLLVNHVGDIAEEENHHPDIYLAFKEVKVRIWTHKIDDLTESDFILAAKIDDAVAALKETGNNPLD